MDGVWLDPHPHIGGIDFNNENNGGIGMNEEPCTGKGRFQLLKGLHGRWLPGQGLGLVFKETS